MASGSGTGWLGGGLGSTVINPTSPPGFLFLCGYSLVSAVQRGSHILWRPRATRLNTFPSIRTRVAVCQRARASFSRSFPCAPDFLEGGVLEEAAFEVATAAWEAFKKANRALYGFLVLCVAQGKDPHVHGILDSCGGQLTRDGLALWRALLDGFGGPSVSRHLALYEELSALHLPPTTSLTESPQQVFGQLELIVQQLSTGGTDYALTPLQHCLQYLRLVRYGGSTWGPLWERFSTKAQDPHWIKTVRPADIAKEVLTYRAERDSAGSRTVSLAAVHNGDRIAELELENAQLRADIGGGGGGGGRSGGGGGGSGGSGGSGNTQVVSARAATSGQICWRFLMPGQTCSYDINCHHLHVRQAADASGWHPDVRPGVTARASPAQVAASLQRNNNANLRSRPTSCLFGQSLPSPFSFVVDSGAQDSLVTTPAGLHNLRPVSGRLHGVAGGSAAITAVGDFAAEACDRKGEWLPFDLREVRVAPEGGFTLLSTSSLCGDGATVTFGGNAAAITFPTTGAVFPLQRHPITGVWILRLRPRGSHASDSAAPTTTALPAASPSGQPRSTGSRLPRAAEAELWHSRLGHPSRQRLLAAQPHLGGHAATLDDCEVCDAGKSRRSAISAGPSATPLPGPGEALTVDLAGPFHRSIQRGELFALIVTDRGSRFRWVWPLKQKSDAAEAFDRFIDTDVRPRGYVARSVRCDSGGEFFGNEFRDVCAQRGIHFDPAAARTPSQNSISESSVRVLEATARCLALESGAPASFWPFMMAAAALTNNCLSTAAVGLEGDAVPWQRWHGTAPPLERLRVFGCLAWVNADDRRERRQGDKFGARGARSTFLGCASEGLAWLCWDGKRIRTSVHVKFQEHRMPWREKPPPAGTPLGLGAVLTAADRASDAVGGGGGGGGRGSLRERQRRPRHRISGRLRQPP